MVDNKNNEWPITNHRYIAFLDIMGFSDFVYRNDHEQVKERMDELINSLTKSNNFGSFFRSEVKHMVFSDSIILLSKKDDVSSLIDLLWTMNIFFFECISSKIPIKGAVSKGLITADFDKSLYFGQALIDAYRLGEELQMYGVVMDHKVEMDLEKYLERKPTPRFINIVKTPTKSGWIRHACLNWMSLIISMSDEENVDKQDMYDPAIRSVNIIKTFYKDMSGYPRKYVDNTIEHIERVFQVDPYRTEMIESLKSALIPISDQTKLSKK